MKNLFDALVLGIVEGLTEFLPVSSTGHLILAGDLLGFDHPSRDVFYLAIQTGAMLAVLWEYRARFFRVDFQLWRNLVVAFIPAAALGLLAGNFIKSYLFKPVPVALAFIIGGMLFGLSRKAATEFSFFLAVPTLIAAGAYDSWKNRQLFSFDDAGMWAVGLVVSFVSAFLVIRWLIRYVATHDFRWFAWYRIVFGLVVLATAWTGVVNWSAG